MASEGIGIFDRQHFVVDANDDVGRLYREVGKPLCDGTHSIIWPVYDWWLQQRASLDLVRDIITPGGQSIRRWFSSTTVDEFFSQKNAQEWLKVMGLDLSLMNRDRGARNASSYGPSAIHGWQVMPAADAVGAIVQLWEMFEPTEVSRFDEVDRLFLRRAILWAFERQSNRRRWSKNWLREFKPFVIDFLERQDEPDTVVRERDYWKRYLTEPQIRSEGTPLDRAERKSLISDSSFPIEMLSRAALLLRVATGSCSLHFNDIGLEWDSLEFWLGSIGIRRGFWNQGAYPEGPIDLWTDVFEATVELEETLPARARPSRGMYEFPSPPHGDSLLKLEECERIGLWGLGV